MKVRIGVVGCADIAYRSVIPAILKLDQEFKLVAVASRYSEIANKFAQEFKCEAIVGYDKIISREDIDALYVPLPSGIHYEWISKAIACGKHVYAEKSFTTNFKDTESLVSKAITNNVILMEGYMFLYHRQQAYILDLINQGKIGEIRHFFSSFGFPPLQIENFRYDEKLGGGVLMDAAGYPLRAAHYYCGYDLEVRSASVYRDPISNTSLWGSAYLCNKKGLGASIAFGFDNIYQCRFEIWGSKGKITAEKAFTPSSTFSPQLLLEDNNGIHSINIEPDNHFINALCVFHKLFKNPLEQTDMFKQILKQSKSLEKIKQFSF